MPNVPTITNDTTKIPLFDENRLYDAKPGSVFEFRGLPTRADKVIYGRPGEGSADSSEYTKRTLSDYMSIRMPGRGTDGDTLVFNWLINPSSIQVGYQTIDSRAMVRSGWTFGLWGDDCVEINMSGQSAGYYFCNGLTGVMKEFTLSHRNLLMLQNVFENNGYFFEGEEMGTIGNLNASYTRKRIKYHEDVQLIYNNFIWYGCFQHMSIESSADIPFRDTFSLTFLAWKERFRDSSPYRNSIQNNMQRGHVRNIWNRYWKSNNERTSPETIQQVSGNNPFLEGGSQSASSPGTLYTNPFSLPPPASPENYGVQQGVSANPLTPPSSFKGF